MEIKPTRCLVVSANSSIHEVMERFDKEDCSYAVLKDGNDNLIGIVTEKDFLKNLDNFLGTGNLENKSIRLIMSHPIKTLTVDMLHLAPEFMLKNSIRRVPIMSRRNSKKIQDLVGIVTERSLLEEIVRSRRHEAVFATGLTYESKKTVGVLSSDGELFNQFDKIFENSDYIQPHRLRYTKLQTEGEISYASELCDAIIMDLDSTPSKSWTSVLKEFNEHPSMETVFVAYTSSEHPDNVVDLMRTLKGKSIFHIYEKPLDLVAMINNLDRIWSGSHAKAA